MNQLRRIAVACLIVFGVAGVVRPGIAFARVSSKRALVIIGMPGSGKSTGADMLSNRLKVPRYSTGDIIRDEVKRQGLPENDPAGTERASVKFASRGRLVGHLMARKVETGPGELAIVEGFRASDQIAGFRERIPHTTVVAVEVGEARRYRQMLARKRQGEDNIDFLRQRDRREVRLGVRKAMARRNGRDRSIGQADVRIRPRGLRSLTRSLLKVAAKAFQ
jgi:dephospho-CoA kinase